MDRRRFLTGLTAGGAAVGVGVTGTKIGRTEAAHETRSLTFAVQGFTCITCAIGLETILRGLRGVTRANATYPEGKVIIGFDENLIGEKALREFISTCGFKVA